MRKPTLTTATFAVTSIAVILIAIEGTFDIKLHLNPCFWAVVVLLMACLTLTVIRYAKSRASLFCHLGFLLILAGGFFGAPFFQEGNLPVYKEEAQCIARASDGRPVELPFSVRLLEFRTDYYEDGESPKQFTSVIDIDGKVATTSVNHPCLRKGWMIYQSGYDIAASDFSVLKFVRDPFLPAVFLGMLLLAIGALMTIGNSWKSRVILPIGIVLAAAFTVISLARINLGTLMPALRSLWFVPHLACYMLAYSALAIALVLSAVALFRKEDSRLAPRLLSTSSSLLVLGMLCGAVWAKMAWGDYWTWDPKECWAAVTWLLTLLGTHLPPSSVSRRKTLFILILLSFLAMQITWYGVNYLPSAVSSLHTYK